MKSVAGEISKAVLIARAEASAWITRLHGPNRSPEMEEGLRRWLTERPENAEEFEGLTEVWDLVATGVPTRGVPRLERWEHTAEARELKALRDKYERGSPPMMRWWVAAALVLMSCGALLYHLWPVASYVTAVGEQRVVQLADGTQVSLNSNTQMAVDYDGSQRRIRLRQGEALFQVAKDAHRPFVVEAGENQVTALGTSFLVRREGERTAITLVEGRVAVSSPDLQAPAASDFAPRPRHLSSSEIVLSPGQRLTLASRVAPKWDTPQLDKVTAWRRGEVVLADTPLVDAVAEMNRYDKTRIVIGSPQIEQLAVSGLYHTGDSEGFAQSVVQMYRLKMTRREGRIELERK